MAAGILNYQNYLQDLSTTSEVGNLFPSSQITVRYAIEAGDDQLGWTAEISWITLIVDRVTWDRDDKPVFTNSLVYGYYEGGSTTQYSDGVISIPQNMYTGPILPTSDVDVPITVVNIKWTKGDKIESNNIVYIQNWEPGVRIGSPYDDIGFEPVFSEPSNLILSSGGYPIIYNDTFTLTAISDIPISLGTNNPCYFYKIVGGESILIGQSYFVGLIATLTLPTTDTFPIDTYEIYAEFSGIKKYGRTISNTIYLEVVEGVDLIVVNQTLTPVKSYYFPGDDPLYTLNVIPNPAFPPSGVAINSPLSVKIINTFTPFTETAQYSGNFSNGELLTNLTINSSMVDTGLTSPNTTYSITTSTNNGVIYTATILVKNLETVKSSWSSQYAGQYSQGTTSKVFTMANTATRTLTITDFPILLSKSEVSTAIGMPLTISAETITTPYNNNVVITAQKGAETITLLNDNQSGSNTISVTTDVLTTGTWTISASYLGDLGTSIEFAHRASTSNTLSHRIRPANELYPVDFYYIKGSTHDTLKVIAYTSTELINLVTFKNGATTLGTGTWTGHIVSIDYPDIFQGGKVRSGMPSINFSTSTTATVSGFIYSPIQGTIVTGSPGYGPADNSDNRYVAPIVDSTTQQITNTPHTPTWETDLPVIRGWYNGITLYNTLYRENQGKVKAQGQGQINPNIYRAWKYYNGSNYDLSLVTGTNIESIVDPITTGSWTVNQIGTQLINSNFNLLYHPKGNGVSTGGYIWNFYDIYRTDDIGDINGYNVVGIDANSVNGQSVPEVSEANPLRLYFIANGSIYMGAAGSSNTESHREHYIDLVEFIGEANWDMPIHNDTEVQHKAKVWLFRFTPTVRQTNTVFKTAKPVKTRLDLIPANTYDLSGNVTGISVDTFGVFKMPADITTLNENEWHIAATYSATGGSANSDSDYGYKKWDTRNAGDSVENAYTHFCNSWYSAFVKGGRISYSIPYAFMSTLTIASVYTSTEIITYGNTQTVTLSVPLGTITTTSNLTASWPGTESDNFIYGKFAPFVETIDPSNFNNLEDYYSKVGTFGTGINLGNLTDAYFINNLKYQSNTNYPTGYSAALNGNIKLVLPYGNTGDCTFRVYITNNTSLRSSDNNQYNYSQYAEMANGTTRYYKDITIPASQITGLESVIEFNLNSIWITSDWWNPTQPVAYWPLAAPGIYPGYISSLNMSLQVSLISGTSIPSDTKIFATPNLRMYIKN